MIRDVGRTRADVTILCTGLNASYEGEEGDEGNAYAGGDKESLKLPGRKVLQAEFELV